MFLVGEKTVESVTSVYPVDGDSCAGDVGVAQVPTVTW